MAGQLEPITIVTSGDDDEDDNKELLYLLSASTAETLLTSACPSTITMLGPNEGSVDGTNLVLTFPSTVLRGAYWGQLEQSTLYAHGSVMEDEVAMREDAEPAQKKARNVSSVLHHMVIQLLAEGPMEEESVVRCCADMGSEEDVRYVLGAVAEVDERGCWRLRAAKQVSGSSNSSRNELRISRADDATLAADPEQSRAKLLEEYADLRARAAEIVARFRLYSKFLSHSTDPGEKVISETLRAYHESIPLLRQLQNDALRCRNRLAALPKQ